MRVMSDMADWAGEMPAVLVAPAPHAQARRSLLRALAARVLGYAPDRIAISHWEGRAPVLVSPAGAGLCLSSSSRAGLAALAVGRGALGLDIEAVEPARDPPWNVLHPEEQIWLAGLDPGERSRAFARLWAAKEAYLKLLGTGLRREPSSFAVLPGATAQEMTVLEPGTAVSGVSVQTAWIPDRGRDFALALAELSA